MRLQRGPPGGGFFVSFVNSGYVIDVILGGTIAIQSKRFASLVQ